MSTNGHGRRDVDVLLASALATGATYEEAGRIAGVSKSTVKRRMGEEAFRQRVAQERVELIDTLRGRLLAAAPQAVATLRELSASGQSDSVRLGAARAVLDLSLGRRRGFDLVQGKEVERVRAASTGADRRCRVSAADLNDSAYISASARYGGPSAFHIRRQKYPPPF
jgi:hypothetical protein